MDLISESQMPPNMIARNKELQKLQPYSSNNPLAQLRTFREEVKRAAKDGKDTLLIPSGETAMKIEGLGKEDEFSFLPKGNTLLRGGVENLNPQNMKVGMSVSKGSTGYAGDEWIITDILGEGKFKAIPKGMIDSMEEQLSPIFGSFPDDAINALAKGDKRAKALFADAVENETFDISGKVDTKNFVYKLNEEAIPREARKMGLEVEGKIKVDNGEWWKINILPERAQMPVEAFGVGAFGLGHMFKEQPEEERPRMFKSKL